MKAVVDENFEKKIKPEFTGNEGPRHTYPVNAFGFDDNPEFGIRDRVLEIPARDIRVKVFDKVISKIQALVRDQVAATGNVKAVLLAGGFGQNAYLKRQVEKAVGSTVEVRTIEDRYVVLNK